MSKLSWDNPESQIFETGLDRGVLYLDEKNIVPWNGLISADVSANDKSITPIYFNGKKTFDLINPGDFTVNVKAFTYPEAFSAYSGTTEVSQGLYFDNQTVKSFGLSYRTLVGNSEEGTALGYKIHILYNLFASAESVSYSTINSSTEPLYFSWSLSSKPEKVTNYRQTAHIILDSTKMHYIPFGIIEDILYGTDFSAPRLPTLDELVSYFTITVLDNGDGTWTAEGPDYLFNMLNSSLFEIDTYNAVYIDADLFRASS